MDWQALFLSLKLAVCSTIILLIIGLPVTFALAKRRHMTVTLLETLFSLPLVLPPTVLGFYLLLLLGPLKLAFSFSGLLIASVISSMPFALQSFMAAFQSVNSSYYENSWTLGESRFMTFIRVALPLAKNGIFAGIILAFAHVLGEFGVVLMIGGNIPGISRTMAIALYGQVEAFDYHSANITALVLVVFSVLALGSVNVLKRKGHQA